ncbi:MAG TPA: CHAT domain-containing tetratricopeptide repeat protein [Ktedonobacteraceae bacterium]
MDEDQLLAQLRELGLQQGRHLLATYLDAIPDRVALGVRLSDNALDQLYTNPADSLKLAEELIFFGELTSQLSCHALGLKARGDALRVLGLHQAALEALDAAGEEFLRLEDKGNWARSRISWITARTWLGDAEQALNEAARAREMFLQLGEHYWVTLLDNNVAVIYSQVGRYQDAIDLCQEMIAAYLTLKDQDAVSTQRAIAMAEANQGEFLSWLGQFAAARRLLLQGQQRFIDLQETSLITYVEMRLADIDLTQGYYGSAIKRYYAASSRLQQNAVDDPLLLAELKLKMASCLIKLNRAQEACRLAGEATQILRERDTSLDTANTLRDYAHILITAGRLKEAISILDEAQAQFQQVGFARSTFGTRLEQAELSLELASPDDAYIQARSAREYFARHGLVERSLHACLIMAQARIFSLQQTEGRDRWQSLFEEAMSLCRQVIHQASQHRLQEGEYRGYWLLGQLALLQGKTSRAWHYHRMAIVRVEEMLENLRYDLSPAFLHTVWPLYENAVYLSLQQKEIARALTYLERARSYALRQYLHRAQARQTEGALAPTGAPLLRLQQELKDWQNTYRHYSMLLLNQETLADFELDQLAIRGEVQQCETKIEELFDLIRIHEMQLPPVTRADQPARSVLPPVDIAALQQFLTENQVLLAYFLYQEKLLIFILSARRITFHEDARGKAELEQLQPFLYAYLEPGSWPDTQHPPQQGILRLLQKLYRLLIAPVETYLPDTITHLTIVPYGLLHQLPFHALHDGSRFLIERFEMSYLPASTVQTYFHQHRLDDVEEKPAHVAPLVFGYSGNGSLQYCINEARTVAELLDGRCYLEQDATIVQLSKQAPGSPVIHIATHGRARLDAPNFSSILLADGQLNAIDAFHLPLQACELVTLSGCETGVSLSGGGDEQLGLGRAFLAAGARSLLISLWPVEDYATSELMRVFYLNLLYGASKMQALRAAQCSLLHRYHHPYFWAAFRLVGDPGLLRQTLLRDTSQKSELLTSLEQTREASFANTRKNL